MRYKYQQSKIYIFRGVVRKKNCPFNWNREPKKNSHFRKNVILQYFRKSVPVQILKKKIRKFSRFCPKKTILNRKPSSSFSVFSKIGFGATRFFQGSGSKNEKYVFIAHKLLLIDVIS